MGAALVRVVRSTLVGVTFVLAGLSMSPALLSNLCPSDLQVIDMPLC